MVATAKTAPRKVDTLLAHYSKTLHPSVAFAFIAANMIYYARLSIVFLVAMLVWSILTYWLILMMGDRVWQTSLAIFVCAWIAQFYGHYVEGKKPSFFEDIQYLWVGPLFVLSKLFEKIGIHW